MGNPVTAAVAAVLTVVIAVPLLVLVVLTPSSPAAAGGGCPMVPDDFKASFRANTGFEWDGLSPDARLLSQCVHANFPAIKVHGTYAAHMDGWDHALDFMMPSDCSNTPTPHTTTAEDLQLGTDLTRYLFQHIPEIGIRYMIWQDRIRGPGGASGERDWVPIDQWRQDNYNNGDCNNTHYNHVHVTVYGDQGTGMPVTSGATGPMGTLTGTPEQIVNQVVDYAHAQGFDVTPASVAVANARHGATVNGDRSDHQGPPEYAWAADISNGYAPTPEMDQLAAAVASAFGIPWSGSGLVTITSGGYSIQLIYRTMAGGNHYNHVHFGVHRSAST